MQQTTISKSFIVKGGVGLHSGIKSDLFIYPAPANTGIVFYRRDKNVSIPANYKYGKVTPLATKLEKDGVSIQTIEHFLASCNALEIDNLLVEISSPEIPLYDGSALVYYEKLAQAGIEELGETRKVIKIIKPISYTKGNITMTAVPAENTVFAFDISFEHNQLQEQNFSVLLTKKNFEEKIMKAKTFALEDHIHEAIKNGLIRGANEESGIILNNEGVISNMEVMTWLNEPNRHKILDQIGDFYLANNLRILGHFVTSYGGHKSNLDFITQLMDHNIDSRIITDEF